MGADTAGVRLRLTRAGAVALVVLLSSGALGMMQHEPVLVSVSVLVLLLLLTSLVMSIFNLRGIVVQRVLPDEVVAGQAAQGRFRLRNPRTRLGAWQIRVEEQGVATASTLIAWLAPGVTRTQAARWRFSERGVVELTELRLSSTAPFGLIEVRRSLSRPAEVVVYPQPRPGGRVWLQEEGRGLDALSSDLRRGSGDLLGLRPYRPGDPLRQVHWPTSARVGSPMVVERAADAAQRVMVEVVEASGLAWENQISEAAQSISVHAGRGDAVGLRLAGTYWPPRADQAWRRLLLEQLARAERR